MSPKIMITRAVGGDFFKRNNFTDNNGRTWKSDNAGIDDRINEKSARAAGASFANGDKEFPYDTLASKPGKKSSPDRSGGGYQPEERDAGLPPTELKIHRRVSQFSFERPCMRIPERAY